MSQSNNKKILVIGDLHIKEYLNYSNYLEDKRVPEEKEVFDYIAKQSEDCEEVVFLGDQLHKKVNPSQTITKFVEFIERFHDKNVYMLKGNHEGHPSGASAIDFLREIKNDKWNIVTNTVENFNIDGINIEMLPYFTKAELEVKSNSDAIKVIKKKLKGADILFHHNAMTHNGRIAGIPLDADQLPEPTLETKYLSKKYSLVFGGHVHSPSKIKENIFVAGSIFNNEVGETQKYIYKINKKDLSVESISLPGRSVIKRENPTKETLKEEEKNSIIKVIFTKKKKEAELREIKKELKKFAAYIIIEKINKKKKKMHYGDGESILDFDINKLLELYAKEKKEDPDILKHGFNLINE